MAVARFRYKLTGGPGLDERQLKAETDVTAAIVSLAQNPICDIDIEATLVADLDEAMAQRGYTRIEGPGVTGSPPDAADFVRRSGDAMSGNLDMAGNRVKSVPDVPAAASDAVNATYVQNAINARDPKDACRLSTGGVDLVAAGWIPAGAGVGKTLTSPNNLVANNNFDGFAAVLNNRILNEGGLGANRVHNGIYVLTQAATGAVPAILTRATDYDQNADVTQGAYTFVEEGTLYEKFGFQLITADPIVVDTTALTISPVTAADNVVAGAGLSRTVNTMALELDTAADAQGAGSGGGSSGLEFDSGGDAGRARVKVDPSGGIKRSAAGLAAELDPAGAVLAGAAGLAVSVDGVTIAIVANALVALAGSPQLSWGANAVAATTTPRYLFPCYNDSLAQTVAIQIRMVRAGTFRQFRVRQNVPAGNGNAIVYTFRKNGVATALSVSMLSTASDGVDLTNSFTVAVGDLVDVEVTKAAGVGTSPSDIAAEVEFIA